MTHSNILLVSTALLVMSAGVVVGRLSDRLPAVRVKGEQHSRSWLADQLKLTADQRQKMDGIWVETRQEVDKAFAARNELERQRDQAVHDLFTPEQRAAFEKINQDYRTSRDELFKERNTIVRDANDRSRALLDESQQKQWDILSKEMRDRRGPMGSAAGPGMGMRNRSENGSGGDRPHRGDHAGGDQSGDRTPANRSDDSKFDDTSTTKPTGGV